MDSELSGESQSALRKHEQSYAALKAELEQVGFVLQGSLTERRMECGKAGCACHSDPSERHGPYYQWSWKDGGRTVSVYLDRDRARRCKEWVNNNRRLDRIVRRMRALSIRAARLYKISKK